MKLKQRNENNSKNHKLREDEKPEPHLPKTQENDKRVKSAYRNINLKIFDRDNKGAEMENSIDGRS